jgi:hypothetical protein
MTLVIGIGNPDRGDDAVGLAVAGRVRAAAPAGVTVIELARALHRLPARLTGFGIDDRLGPRPPEAEGRLPGAAPFPRHATVGRPSSAGRPKVGGRAAGVRPAASGGR